MYNLLLLYLIVCFLYRITINFIYDISNCIYQNASSKNRVQIKSIKEKIQFRKKIYIVFIWPLYELYFLAFKNEWKYFAIRIFVN